MSVRAVWASVPAAALSIALLANHQQSAGGTGSAGEAPPDFAAIHSFAESESRLVVHKAEDGSIKPGHREDADAMVLRAKREGSIRLIVEIRGDPILDDPFLAARLDDSTRQSLVDEVVDEFLDDIQDHLLGEGRAHLIRYRFIPYLTLRLDSEGVEAVLSRFQVRSINTEGKGVPLLNASVPFIGADVLHNQNNDGSGYVIAIIDTGVYSAHEMFPMNKIVEQACFSTPVNNQDTCSTQGDGEPCVPRIGSSCLQYHGTHAAGIAAGASVSACVGQGCSDLDDNLKGVAKSAGIISINVVSIDDSESTYTIREGDVIDALDEVYSHRNSYNIASVNMSFTLSVDFSDWADEQACNSDWSGVTAAVNVLHASGIAVIAASGNCGTDELEGCGTGAPGVIAPPACIGNVISVSAVRRSVDTHASYANVADILDMLAPAGNTDSGSGPCAQWADGVWSASHQWPPGSGNQCEDGYHRGIGTSTAAPHVTGSIALLREEYGSAATPSAMRDLLKETGATVNLTQGGKNYSFPRIDLDAALTPPAAPGAPNELNVDLECFDLYKLTWPAPSSGTVTEYQIEGSFSDTFFSTWREWFGPDNIAWVIVDDTTYFRVRACNTVSCSGWTVGNSSASPSSQCP